MPINVLVNGAFGRMGQMVVKTLSGDPRFTLVGQTGREYNLKKAIQDSKAQVVVDFTHPEAVYSNTLAIIEAGAHPVIGTTGLTQEQISDLKQRCERAKLGGIIAPNFSIGAVLMMQLAKDMAKHMPHVEIIELHHDNKADSPSGTALRCAEMLANDTKGLNQPLKPSRETIPGARGATHHNIPIHAIRLPGLLAHLQVIFGNTGETVTLRHDSIDRECFMPGIGLACEKVVGLNQMVYGLENILS